MKNISFILNSSLKTLKSGTLYIFLLITFLLIFVPITLAQNEPAQFIADDMEVSTSALKKYLSDNYAIQKVDLQIVKDTYGHQRKYLHIKGDLTPKETVTPNKGEPGRTRAIAQAFLEKEVGPLFGINNIADIREFEILTDLIGWSHWPYVRYRQYVGDLPLYGSLIQVKIGSNEKISAVDAYLEPVPPELLQVVSRKTLAEDEIRKIVEDDIKVTANPPHPMLINLEKFATTSPPYVIWKAYTIWEYTIDAFTGKILKKLPETFDVPQKSLGNGVQSYSDSTATIQPPISGRVSVVGSQSWKLDNSGAKTNEKIPHDMNMMKEIKKSPADLNK